MKIEHIALYVRDIEVTKNFYMKYFFAKSNEKYTNAKGFSSYFLTFEDGARLEIMSRPKLNRPGELPCFGYAHIAVSVGSVQCVNELTERFEKDGYDVISAPRITGDGYYESVIADPDGNPIEITV
ncbi:MAG: VOC family protein [Ruminococcus sp.]|nr:VOC family protein [Ruminococcus sp.]